MTRTRTRENTDELRIEVIDHTERAMREHADDAMQAALMREHPDRVTESHPPGTKSPRRIPMPIAGNLKTNFD